ncbi:MAG: hypothetical protein LC804_27445 [Acidobacteria bacterium]|nr:hypothetical protein [Acidobacteriota bacterium]
MLERLLEAGQGLLLLAKRQLRDGQEVGEDEPTAAPLGQRFQQRRRGLRLTCAAA